MTDTVQIGDRVRLRKAHPCGSKEWSVYRVGADIGLTCATCGRHILLSWEEFEKRCIQHTPKPESEQGQ